MAVLAPYGITNERFDQVSNYYGYQSSLGQLWPTRPAKAYLVAGKDGGLRYVVTDGGCGYTSPPVISVPSISVAGGGATLSFSKDFNRNGSVTSISYSNSGILRGVPVFLTAPTPTPSPEANTLGATASPVIR